MIYLDFLQKIIEIYVWTVAVFILIFITAIAKFYQNKFGIKTFYYFYIVPIIVLFAAAIQFYYHDTFLSELIEFLGSVTSFLVSYYLFRIMVGVKNEPGY
jgi:predicted membrane protein